MSTVPLMSVTTNRRGLHEDGATPLAIETVNVRGPWRLGSEVFSVTWRGGTVLNSWEDAHDEGEWERRCIET